MVRIENRLMRSITVKGNIILPGGFITIPVDYDQSLKNLVKDKIVSVVEIAVSDPLIGEASFIENKTTKSSARTSRKRN